MLISHEIPVALFTYNSIINDYPYLLAHLLLKKYHLNEEYAEYYKKYCQTQEYVILDNSVFELGKPVAAKELLSLVDEYNVSHLVVPDIYKDKTKTIEAAKKFIPSLYNKSKAKLFAVAQGSTVEETIECFEYFFKRPEIDIIGINFSLGENARKEILEYIKEKYSALNPEEIKLIHLLGTANPYDLWSYARDYKSFIKSVDTSNPVMMALEGREYNPARGINGEYIKPKALLADSLNTQLNVAIINLALRNIRTFRRRILREAL